VIVGGVFIAAGLGKLSLQFLASQNQAKSHQPWDSEPPSLN
jgi:hypothetical protein